VFLGRGVSKGLADRRAKVEKLPSAGLPVLAAPADVAQALGLPIARLRWLAFHTEASTTTHYVRFTVPKKSGGTRELAARALDRRLSAIAQKLGWTYTRYADDLTFSASGEPATKAGDLLARLRHIAQDEGFAVNEEKTRVQRRSTAQAVTGVVVNEKPAAPRAMRRRLRAILHQAKKSGWTGANRNGEPRFEAKARGSVAYVAMLDAGQGHKLKATLADAQ
jgi:hypothetical protein